MRILFQGDSITDALRNKENISSAGTGYAQLIKATLGFEEPQKYEIINKGINASRVVDVYSRIGSDIINLAPDVLSILIGVNDIWQFYAETPNGTSREKYYKLYDMLIEEIKEALPDVKIMILEPFLLHGIGTNDKYEGFRSRVEELAIEARKIAEKHDLIFVPLQEGFDELFQKTGEGYWLTDGVHPTPMGHEFIKREWLKAFEVLR